MAGIPHTGVLAFLYILFIVKPKDEEREKKKKIYRTPPKKKPIPLPKEKNKDDIYTKFIGQSFEKKGELVIYNGFIYPNDDRGVDVISICIKTKTINLIQCKYCSDKKILMGDIEEVYRILSVFNINHIIKNNRSVQTHLQIKKDMDNIEEILTIDKSDFRVRKTLYIHSDTMIDLKMSRKLKQIKSNIFRYENMKIVKTN